MSNKVLVVDDEKELALIVQDYLESEGFNVYTAFTGQEAYQVFEREKPDIVVLDIMLPDDDGMEICRSLSLGLGADEYLTKPYSPAVIVAHVKALLRRYRIQNTSDRSAHVIKKGKFLMDFQEHAVYTDEVPIDIKGKEFEVLWFLAVRAGKVFTKEQIYDAVWGEDEFGELSTVTVHIRKIRSKFEKAGSYQYIKTIWGVGYKFEHE